MICRSCRRHLPHTAQYFTASSRYDRLTKTCHRCSEQQARHRKVVQDDEVVLPPEGKRQIKPNCYRTVGGDWPKDRLFNRGEFNETLALGYFPPGLAVESLGVRYVVAGEMLAAQELVPE